MATNDARTNESGEQPGQLPDGDAGSSVVVQRPGGLTVESFGGEPAEVQVRPSKEAVGLAIVTEAGEADVMLMPEDVAPLTRKLVEAAAATDPAAVDEAREWADQLRGDFEGGG